jgi:hypothetical protein
MKRQTKTRLGRKASFHYQLHGSSNEGMQTAVWGPILWTFLHIMSFNYPLHPTRENKIHYKRFIDELPYILPCRTCRENLPENMKKANYGKHCFENREALSRFVWRLHNQVSGAINDDPNNTTQKIIEKDYNKVAEKFELIRAKCNTDSERNTRKLIMERSKHVGCTSAQAGQKRRKCKISISEIDTNDINQCSSLEF